MRDIITEIWATARRNKLRTALTGFAVAWGIFMLIFLLGSGNGLINAMMSNSDNFLSNSMMVFGGQTSKGYKGLQEGRSIDLNDKDMSITGHSFSGNVDEVGAEIHNDSAVITLGENYVSSSILGVYPNAAKINKREMTAGRFINDIDMQQRRKVVVVSDQSARELSPHQNTDVVGQTVKISNLGFTIVGVYKNDQSMMGNDAYIPFTTFRTVYNSGDKVGNIMFSFHGLSSQKANDDFEKRYKATINMQHQAAPDDDNAVWIWNRFTQNLQMNQGIGIIRMALWIVGLFTLLSGVVGVSNIMLISVKERTREFGIRKAIGAKPSSILRLIIIESIIITTLFGFIGMLAGIAANQYMDVTTGNMQTNTGLFQMTVFLHPTVGFDVCFEALIVMVVAGTIAGLIPARRAAHVRPIEALRAE
ncbi:MAG: ABC transporter permease [Prevotella sp.]